MVDHKKERELQLMRMMLVAAQTAIIVNDVQVTTVAGPLPISIDNAAQSFEGWGTSLAWFAEYVGCLEGGYNIPETEVLQFCCTPDQREGVTSPRRHQQCA